MDRAVLGAQEHEQRISAAVNRHRRHARLHLLPLCPVDVLPIDFSRTNALIEDATQATLHWLDRLAVS